MQGRDLALEIEDERIHLRLERRTTGYEHVLVVGAVEADVFDPDGVVPPRGRTGVHVRVSQVGHERDVAPVFLQFKAHRGVRLVETQFREGVGFEETPLGCDLGGTGTFGLSDLALQPVESADGEP